MHLLSRVAYQEGHVDEALDLMGKSLALKPDQAEARLDLGSMLVELGRLDEAVAAYQQAISIKPGWSQPRLNLGTVFKRQGRPADAIACFEKAIELEPGLIEAHHKLGILLYEIGHVRAAIAVFERATALFPGNAWAHAVLGDWHRDNGHPDRAACAYQRAIAAKPDWAEAHSSLGEALRLEGQLEPAMAACRQAIALQPGLAQAHNNLANALKEAGQLDAAIAAYRRASELAPNSAPICNNLGVGLKEAGHLDEARAIFQRAISLDPQFADAHNNLAACLREQGHFEEAMPILRRAIRLKPDFAIAHFNLAMSLLTRGDFAQGWEEYEWRWKCTEFSSKPRGFSQPLWDGSDLENRTLLLHAEQGFGDTIQFIRYLPMVAKRGGRILLECQRELVRLLQSYSSICQLIPRGDPLPAFDLHCPLLSLPRIFQTTVDSIPSKVPYLFPPQDLVERWRNQPQFANRPFKVGLAWAGSPAHRNDATRSLSLDQLAPLGRLSEVTFYSLQKGPAATQTTRPPAGMTLIDLSPDLHDFADTAAAISQMDLVIAADTAVCHLAGALRKPAWTLLRFAAEWRWLSGRADTPWYPSMRLFHQHSPGDWDSVLTQVATALESMRHG
jgi:tetratricopeptide (TPR) repeat protein